MCEMEFASGSRSTRIMQHKPRTNSIGSVRASSYEEIKRICDHIAREFHPEKIILFGSHAYGKPEWHSDVDLLVIMPFKGTPHRQDVEIRSRINTGMALDLLVRTPQQVKRRLEMGDSFMREILERGKVVYEAVTTPMGLHRVAQGCRTRLPWDNERGLAATLTGLRLPASQRPRLADSPKGMWARIGRNPEWGCTVVAQGCCTRLPWDG